MILVVSPVRYLRDALVQALSEDGLPAQAAFSAATVVAAVRDARPDLLLVDAAQPDGRFLVTLAREHAPMIRAMVVAGHDLDEEFLAWADVGISAYAGPDSAMSDLLLLARRALKGEVVCPPRLTGLLLNEFGARQSRGGRASVHVLTAREREIVALIAAGLPNKLIARQLRVALPTVKNHVHSILDKWSVKTRGQAAALYRTRMGAEAPAFAVSRQVACKDGVMSNGSVPPALHDLP